MINREQHCPFLLRVFCNVGAHKRRVDYEQRDDGATTSNELHIYTWPDATLREIADLVQDANTDAQGTTMRMAFSIVSEDPTGRVVLRKAGWVHANRRKTMDEEKTLERIGLRPGDLLDVALMP